MKLRKSEIGVLAIIIASFGLSVFVFPMLPEKVASHWGINGEVNGYMPAFWGAFLMPIISVAMFAIFAVIPRVDPKKKNIEKFRDYFDEFILLFFLFMFYIHLLTIYWNVGGRFNMVQYMSPAFALLFIGVGILISHAESNWSIGIRTPWTLSNETVWKKTHALGGKMFMISGAIALFGVVLPDFAIWLMLVPVLLTALTTIVYSYLEYRKIS
jgi:uncharacterized membrane protein